MPPAIDAYNNLKDAEENYDTLVRLYGTKRGEWINLVKIRKGKLVHLAGDHF